MAGRKVRKRTNLSDPKDKKLGKGKDRTDDEDISLVAKIFLQMAAPQQDHLTDEQLLPRARWFKTTSNNHRLRETKFGSPGIEFFYIMLGHPLRHALTNTSSVPEVYMQQFWTHIVQAGDSYKSVIDQTEVTVTRDLLHTLLQLPGANYYEGVNCYAPMASNEQICADILALGYDGHFDRTNHFTSSLLPEPWKTAFGIINRCLSPKHSGHDKANVNIMRIFHGVVMNLHYNYTDCIWADFQEAVRTKSYNKSANVMPYLRFTCLLVRHFMVTTTTIRQRFSSLFHAPQLILLRQERKPSHGIPRVLPLSLIHLADQTNPKIARYRRKFYDGDNLRAQPLPDDELDVQEVQGDDAVVDQGPPLEGPPRVLRNMKIQLKHQGTSSRVQEIVMPQPLASAPIVSTSDVAVVSEISASQVSVALQSVLAGINKKFPVSQSSLLVDPPTAFQSLDASLLDLEPPVVSLETTPHSVYVDIPVSSAPELSVSSVPLSVESIPPITITSTSVPAVTSEVMPHPLYSISTSHPVITGSTSSSARAASLSSSLYLTKSYLETTLKKLVTDLNDQIDKKMDAFKADMFDEVTTLIKSSSQELYHLKGVMLEEEPVPPPPPRVTASDFSLDELKTAMIAKLSALFPGNKNASLIELLVLEESSKQASLKRGHDDQHDRDQFDSHEGEKRQRLDVSGASSGTIVQESSQEQPPQSSQQGTSGAAQESEKIEASKELSFSSDSVWNDDNDDDDADSKLGQLSKPELNYEELYKVRIAADVDALFEDQPKE